MERAFDDGGSSLIAVQKDERVERLAFCPFLLLTCLVKEIAKVVKSCF